MNNEEIAAFIADASTYQKHGLRWQRLKRRAWQQLNQKDIDAAKARGEGEKYVIAT
ncbi:hypothetical protein [Thalassospira lohafexi]|uniref:hypothetical protein n=1 Tax=Thalassospira lohafexi TaxID=744227 RepID=UPI0013FD3114|nr:hypothetical protein [Thalassospira lohafexi]